MFGEDGFDLINRPVATTTFVSRIHLRNLGDEYAAESKLSLVAMPSVEPYS